MRPCARSSNRQLCLLLTPSLNISERSADDSGPNIAIISTNSVQVSNKDSRQLQRWGKRRGS